MKSHETDPTTEPGPDPWNSFHEEFRGLGKRLKDTYHKVASGGGPSEEEIREAFSTLFEAWDQVAESVSTAMQDPEVRQKLKAAASSFASAVGNTISELGTELSESPRWTHGASSDDEISSEEE